MKNMNFSFSSKIQMGRKAIAPYQNNCLISSTRQKQKRSDKPRTFQRFKSRPIIVFQLSLCPTLMAFSSKKRTSKARHVLVQVVGPPAPSLSFAPVHNSLSSARAFVWQQFSQSYGKRFSRIRQSRLFFRNPEFSRGGCRERARPLPKGLVRVRAAFKKLKK